MSRRSNCTSAEKAWKINPPEGVVVSMALPQTKRNPTPMTRSRSISVTSGGPNAQSVEAPDQQDVARAELAEAGIETWLFTLCARRLVGEDPLVRDSVVSQGIELESQPLAFRADPRVSDKASVVGRGDHGGCSIVRLDVRRDVGRRASSQSLQILRNEFQKQGGFLALAEVDWVSENCSG
jgi:hypothetical protein